MAALRRTEHYSWREVDYIGWGSFAVVYKGRNRDTDEMVAVKVFKTKKNENLTRQYVEDVQKLILVKSPYIIRYYAQEKVEDVEGKQAVIMELAESSLQHELDKPENRFGLPKKTFVVLVDHCVKALKVLDSHHIAHRDLKPENILICRNPELTFKLADFGCSRSLSSPEETMLSMVGTPHTMPSVVIKGKALGLAAGEYTKDQFDIWSVACCFFKSATGRYPFAPKSEEHYYAVMNQLLTHREPDTVCTSYDTAKRHYVYQKHLPKQHSSYKGVFRRNLCNFFQLVFSKEKKYLELEKFSELCKELVEAADAKSSLCVLF